LSFRKLASTLSAYFEFTWKMKTYVLGAEGDRIHTVKKTDGQYVVTIKRKDDDNKFVELPPKRLVTINISLLFF